MELKDLKQNLKIALKQSGAVDSIRAQMRKDFITSMNNKPISSEKSNIDNNLALSIIFHTLRYKHLENSLSVYSAEVGFESSHMQQYRLSEAEICKQLNVPFTNETSVLEAIIKDTEGRKRNASVTTSIQTENTSNYTSNFTNIKESLDVHMREIKSSYLMKREIEREIPTRTIEERMYQLCNNVRLECETKFKADHESIYLQLNSEKMKLERLQLEYNTLISSRSELGIKFEEIRQSQELLLSSEKAKNALLTTRYNDAMEENNKLKEEFEKERKLLVSQVNMEKSRILELQHKYGEIVASMTDHATRFEEDKRTIALQLKSEKAKYATLQGTLNEAISDISEVTARYEEVKQALGGQIDSEKAKNSTLQSKYQEKCVEFDALKKMYESLEADRGVSKPITDKVGVEFITVNKIKYINLQARCRELEALVKDQQLSIANFLKMQRKHQLLQKLNDTKDSIPAYPQYQYGQPPLPFPQFGVNMNGNNQVYYPSNDTAQPISYVPAPLPVQHQPNVVTIQALQVESDLKAKELLELRLKEERQRDESNAKRIALENELNLLRQREEDRKYSEMIAEATLLKNAEEERKRKAAAESQLSAATLQAFAASKEKPVVLSSTSPEIKLDDSIQRTVASAAVRVQTPILQETQNVADEIHRQKLQQERQLEIESHKKRMEDEAEEHRLKLVAEEAKWIQHKQLVEAEEAQRLSERREQIHREEIAADQARGEREAEELRRQERAAEEANRIQQEVLLETDRRNKLAAQAEMDELDLQRRKAEREAAFLKQQLQDEEDARTQKQLNDQKIADEERKWQEEIEARRRAAEFEAEQVRLSNIAAEEARRLKEMEEQRLAQVERDRLFELESQRRIAEREAEEEKLRKFAMEEAIRLKELEDIRIAEDERVRVEEEEQERVRQLEAQSESEKQRLIMEAAEEERKRQLETEDTNAFAEARRKVLERRKQKQSLDDQEGSYYPSVASSMVSTGSISGGTWLHRPNELRSTSRSNTPSEVESELEESENEESDLVEMEFGNNISTGINLNDSSADSNEAW